MNRYWIMGTWVLHKILKNITLKIIRHGVKIFKETVDIPIAMATMQDPESRKADLINTYCYAC
jgi:hypothetical protein